MRRRRLWSAAVAALAALTLTAVTGCSHVPDQSAVQQGLGDLQQADQYVQFDPTGPVPGSSQEEIIRGFVNAASSTANNYAVAREFLTPNYAGQWKPSSGVIIDDSSRPYKSGGDSVGVLSVSTVATVDDRGVLTTVPPGPTSELRFELERVGGEWRISSAPAGVVLDRTTFTAVWSQHPVYFQANTGGFVADQRWFPSRSSLVTNIVQALMRGPSEPLQNAARTLFPDSASLLGNSVPVSEGNALVEVTGEVGTLAPSAMSALRKQLQCSLLSVSGVTSFTLSVEGVEAANDSVSSCDPGDAPQHPPVVKLGGDYGTLDSAGRLTPLTTNKKLQQLGVTAFSVSEARNTVAVRTNDGVSAVSPEGVQRVDGRPGVLAPSVDRFGYIWSTTPQADTSLQAFLPGVTAKDFDPPGKDSNAISGIRVSPDGNWLATMLPSAAGTEVRVSAIVRDKAGTPVAVSKNELTVAWASGQPLDFDWIDNNRVALLTAVAKSGKITVGGFGAFMTERGSIGGAKALTGTTSRGQIRVLTRSDELMAPQGVSGWQVAIEKISLLGKWG